MPMVLCSFHARLDETRVVLKGDVDFKKKRAAANIRTHFHVAQPLRHHVRVERLHFSLIRRRNGECH